MNHVVCDKSARGLLFSLFTQLIDFSANSLVHNTVRGKSCNDVIPVSQSAARSASESCQGRSKINVLFPLCYCSLQSLALSQTFYTTLSSAPASFPNCRINMFEVNFQTFGNPVLYPGFDLRGAALQGVLGRGFLGSSPGKNRLYLETFITTLELIYQTCNMLNIKG